MKNEDLEILRERHPNATVPNDLPDDWIVIIDELLCRFKYAQLSYINIYVEGNELAVGISINEYKHIPFHDFITGAQNKIEKLKEKYDLEK